MAVTPNFSWPVPVATDYVKDGWEAISDLGNAIDTTVAGLGSGAFTFITSSTFTSQSSVSINNCFSSTYQAYKIIMSFSNPSADCGLRFLLRASGTNSTVSYYGMKLQVNTAGGVGSYGDNGANWIGMFDMDSGATSTLYSSFTDIINPFVNTKTTFFMNNTNVDGGGNPKSVFGGNFHDVSASYDGFHIYSTAGTFSGNIRVYGYANS